MRSWRICLGDRRPDPIAAEYWLWRMRDGSRKVTSVTEVVGMEGETIVLNEIFKYQEAQVREGVPLSGEFSPTGFRPMFESRLVAAGFKLAPELYGAGIIQLRQPNGRR